MDAYANPQALAELNTNLRKQASWFYWIAGLSAVNTIAIASGADFSFIMGLGITQIIDGIGFALTQEGLTWANIATLIISLIVCGLFAGIGYLAVNKSKVAFIIGLVIYTLDALIFLAFFDLMPLAFHALALYFLFKGFQTLNTLKQVEAALNAPSVAPPETSA